MCVFENLDSQNQLKSSVEGDLVVNYRYGSDGQRAVKSSVLGETLYFNNMFQMTTTAMGMRQTKHIYVGDTRIATKNNWWKDATTDYEKYNTYWYHGDHLGSAQLVSDYRGDEYERIEYTPYGETWIEKVKSGFESINYRFTGKEQDSETGLYYYGARYLDPKYSRWLSCDPALGEYVPSAGSDTSKLPGMGGVYNTVNLNLYHYAGNNPVKYTDPDGKYMNIYVLKSRGTMEVMFTKPNDTNTYAISETSIIVSNVNIANPDNNKSSDSNRHQSNGTNPTQLKNGTYNINGSGAPSEKVNPNGKYGTGKQGLLIDATQSLEVTKPRSENFGEFVDDTGYMIHITPNEFTDGCIGIPYDPKSPESRVKAEALMNKLVEIFEQTMSKYGDKKATITIMD